MLDVWGEGVVGDVGEGDVFEHVSDRGPDRDPHGLQRCGRLGVVECFGSVAADVREGAVHGADDVGMVIWFAGRPST